MPPRRGQASRTVSRWPRCAWRVRGADYEPDLPTTESRKQVLYRLAVILIVLWLLGLVSSYTLNGFVHVLLVVAVILVLVRVISGRKVV